MPTDILPETTHHVIVAGPSEDRIKEASLRSIDPTTIRPPLKFTTGSDIALLSLYITGMQLREGTGTPLDIQGHLPDGKLFAGHYNASTRSGFIDVLTS